MFGLDLFGKAVKSVSDGVNNVVQTFTGSEKERDLHKHNEYINTQKSFSSEFHSRNNRTLWDSFWDGINRMPRPLFVVLVVAYFILSYVSPEEFQVLNIGLSTVPEKMWYVLSAIIGFYFCARELHKVREKNGMAIDPQEFIKLKKQIDTLREDKNIHPQKRIHPPLNLPDNPSIEAWLQKEK